MRIDANIQENRSLQQRMEGINKTDKTAKAGRTGKAVIHASELNLISDSIAERKKKAMKDAMAMIGKQFETDAKIDEDLSERRTRIAERKEAASAALKEINALSEEQKKLQEAYGVAGDSAQQEEYQQQVMELEQAKAVWKKEMEEAQQVISLETQVIRGTKQELLKYHGMVDAQNAAEQSLKAASDQVIGMLVQEGMEHIQEEVEEEVEKAEEIKEQKEEQEALREEKKAEEKEQEQQLKSLPDMVRLQKEVEQQLQKILEEQKLLEEDLKGIQVDGVI